MATSYQGVFIGGSGQSGTSMLNGFFYAHREVLACPFETCFIIATNGVMDLVRAISDEYCPFRLDAILHDFDRLMHHHLCSPRSYPYNRFDLASFFGQERYHTAIDRFFARLGVVRYKGDGLATQPFLRIGRFHSPFKFKRLWLPDWLARERTYLYHAERQTVQTALLAAGCLLDDLFTAKAHSEGKHLWCEQTTTNQSFADFILKLYPDALYINMARNPFDVALAHQAQAWGPNDFGMVCRSLRALYERWLAIRAVLPPDSLLEVRFEDLIAAPERELGRVCQKIGIQYDPRMMKELPDVERLKEESTRRRQSADLATFSRILGPVTEQLGYAQP